MVAFQAVHADREEHAPELMRDDTWHVYDGRVVSAIHIRGAYFSKEKAVRAILGVKEGDVFDADTLLYGVRKLYNTTVVYDVTAHFTSPRGDTGPIEITLHFIDKFPVLPNVNFQGGGGSQSVGLGLIHANLGGYFTNLSFQIIEFNNQYSYDFNLFQEWLLDTDYVFGLDVSKSILPMNIQNAAGALTQTFTWSRQLNQLLLGKRFGQKVRLYFFLEQFHDAMENSDGAAGVFPGGQFRVRSVFILGRSNLTNFLEEGYELSLTPQVTNPTDPLRRYGAFNSSFKRVWILLPNDNLGLYFGAGAMTSAPLPYQFHLGGYDTVRGFSTFRLMGRAYAFGTAEYRPYIYSFRSRPFGIDLDLIVLQGAIFMDAGAIAGSTQGDGLGSLNTSLGLLSAGGGVRINFVKFPQAIIRLDMARTLHPNEGWGFSFSLGQFF